jgi:hypothetical protein
MGGHCLGRPLRGATQVEKSLHLNWSTQLLTVTHNGALSHIVSLKISFGILLCNKGKENWMKALV